MSYFFIKKLKKLVILKIKDLKTANRDRRKTKETSKPRVDYTFIATSGIVQFNMQDPYFDCYS